MGGHSLHQRNARQLVAFDMDTQSSGRRKAGADLSIRKHLVGKHP